MHAVQCTQGILSSCFEPSATCRREEEFPARLCCLPTLTIANAAVVCNTKAMFQAPKMWIILDAREASHVHSSHIENEIRLLAAHALSVTLTADREAWRGG